MEGLCISSTISHMTWVRFPTKSIDELDAVISADFFNGAFRSTVLTAALALRYSSWKKNYLRWLTIYKPRWEGFLEWLVQNRETKMVGHYLTNLGHSRPMRWCCWPSSWLSWKLTKTNFQLTSFCILIVTKIQKICFGAHLLKWFFFRKKRTYDDKTEQGPPYWRKSVDLKAPHLWDSWLEDIRLTQKWPADKSDV